MLNNILEELFYSRMLKNIREQHYKMAYDQGKFDTESEMWLKDLEKQYSEMVNVIDPVEEYKDKHIDLFKFSGEDFLVWQSEENGIKYYNIGIEGYIGFKEIESFVSLYEDILTHFEEYLVANHDRPNINKDKESVYKTRAVDVRYWHENYWIFLDGYKSTEIWDLYYYVKDVIEQLREAVLKTKEN